VIAFGVSGLWTRTQAQQVLAQGAGGPRYSIVDTEGTNLLVVDNMVYNPWTGQYRWGVHTGRGW
jgi:hypothetical protein